MANPYAAMNPLGAGLAQVPEAYRRGLDIQEDREAARLQREQAARLADMREQQMQTQLDEAAAMREGIQQFGAGVSTPEGYGKLAGYLAQRGHPMAVQATQEAEKLLQDKLKQKRLEAVSYVATGDAQRAQKAFDEISALDKSGYQTKYLGTSGEDSLGNPLQRLEVTDPTGNKVEMQLDNIELELMATRDIEAFNKYRRDKQRMITDIAKINERKQLLQSKEATAKEKDQMYRTAISEGFDPSQPLPPALESAARYVKESGKPLPIGREKSALLVNARAEYFAAVPESYEESRSKAAGTQPGAVRTKPPAPTLSEIQDLGKIRQDFMRSSTGSRGGDLKALKTALEHIKEFETAADEMRRSHLKQYPAQNYFTTWIKKQTGQTGAVQFDVIKSFLADEVVKLVKGSSITKTEAAKLDELMSKYNSPQQTDSVINALLGIMQGRSKSLDLDYKKVPSNKGKSILDEFDTESVGFLKRKKMDFTAKAYGEERYKKNKQPAIGDTRLDKDGNLLVLYRNPEKWDEVVFDPATKKYKMSNWKPVEGEGGLTAQEMKNFPKITKEQRKRLTVYDVGAK